MKDQRSEECIVQVSLEGEECSCRSPSHVIVVKLASYSGSSRRVDESLVTVESSSPVMLNNTVLALIHYFLLPY